MNKLLLSTIIGATMLLMPVFAMATSLTGTIQGYNSVARGKVPPSGKEVHMPTHVAAVETAFVLLEEGLNGKHYLIQNVDIAVLAKLINQKVKIEGAVNMASETLSASDIYTIASGKSLTKVWSSNPWDDVHRDFLGNHPLQGP